MQAEQNISAGLRFWECDYYIGDVEQSWCPNPPRHVVKFLDGTDYIAGYCDDHIDCIKNKNKLINIEMNDDELEAFMILNQ